MVTPEVLFAVGLTFLIAVPVAFSLGRLDRSATRRAEDTAHAEAVARHYPQPSAPTGMDLSAGVDTLRGWGVDAIRHRVDRALTEQIARVGPDGAEDWTTALHASHGRHAAHDQDNPR